MKRIPVLFVILAGCAVRSDDSNNYYIVELPIRENRRPFKVYWNVPTVQCKTKKIPFENLYEKFGIIQNKNDSFRGDAVAILYDPGRFPALFLNESSGKFRFRNGGVPQEGNLTLHLDEFRRELTQSIPNEDFDGIAIIDFESWRPVFRQNFGVLEPYKDVSYQIERRRHRWWLESWIKHEAKVRFEEAGRQFMEETILLAKRLRPKASWGYYGFPYCFNRGTHGYEECSKVTKEENDRSSWLWRISDTLYPSVYSPSNLTGPALSRFVGGRVREARRAGEHVVPYVWYRYRDHGFMDKKDVNTLFNSLYQAKADGFLIWGSSNDVNTKEKCEKLHDYIYNVFGPIVANYTKLNKMENDEEQIEINLFTETAIDEPEMVELVDLLQIINEELNKNENQSNRIKTEEKLTESNNGKNYTSNSDKVADDFYNNFTEQSIQNSSDTITTNLSINDKVKANFRTNSTNENGLYNNSKEIFIETQDEFNMNSKQSIHIISTESDKEVSTQRSEIITNMNTVSDRNNKGQEYKVTTTPDQIVSHSTSYYTETTRTNIEGTSKNSNEIPKSGTGFTTVPTDTDLTNKRTQENIKQIIENNTENSKQITATTNDSKNVGTTEDVNEVMSSTESTNSMESSTILHSDTNLEHLNEENNSDPIAEETMRLPSMIIGNYDANFSTTEVIIPSTINSQEGQVTYKHKLKTETTTEMLHKNDHSAKSESDIKWDSVESSTISMAEGLQQSSFLQSRTTDQVMKSASNSLEKQRIFVCFFFYFVSISRCLCEIFNQCS